jgi:hypothetical protein
MISGKNPGVLALFLYACGIGHAALAQATQPQNLDPVAARLLTQRLTYPLSPPVFSPLPEPRNPMPQPPAREPLECRLEKSRLNCEPQRAQQ